MLFTVVENVVVDDDVVVDIVVDAVVCDVVVAKTNSCFNSHDMCMASSQISTSLSMHS